VAALLFLLLREWLNPLAGPSAGGFPWEELAVLHRPLTAALLAMVVLHWLRLPFLWNLPLHAAVILAVLERLYFPGAGFSPSAWLDNLGGLSRDLGVLLLGRWEEAGPAAWMTVFLAGMSMLVFSVYHLSLERQTAGLLTVATLGYVLVLAAAGWGEWQAALRVFVWGLALAAVQRLSVFQARWLGRALSPRVWLKWSLAGAAVIALSAAAGVYGAKGEALAWIRSASAVAEQLKAGEWAGQWARQMQHRWTQLWDGSAAGTGGKAGLGPGAADPGPAGAGVTGYRPGWARIGGDVTPDDSVAFVAVTERRGYWKGETLDYYTGTGWAASGSVQAGAAAGGRSVPAGGTSAGGVRSVPAAPDTRGTFGQEGFGQGAPGQEAFEKETFVQEVFVRNPALSHLLFAAGEVAGVLELKTSVGSPISPLAVRRDPLSGRYELAGGPGAGYYRLLVAPAPSRFEPARPAGQPFGPRPLTEAERAAYLQLPDDLPERVRELARRLTEGAVSAEQKAQAVETFLREHYAYALTGVEIPRGADAADHFLFESRKGYCDHFSTAMTVLLRAAGVPARWAKGFASGEAELYDGPGLGRWIVTVRNSDAHSWTEVYVEGKGWVAFEPTPGFGAGAAVAASSGPGLPASDDRASDGASRTDRFFSVLTLPGLRPMDWSEMRGAVRGAAWVAAVAAAAAGTLVLVRRAAAAGRGAVPLAHPGLRPKEGNRLVAFCLRRLARRFGAIGGGQTLREYLLSLSLPAEHRDARKRELERLAELLEEAVYGPQQAGGVGAAGGRASGGPRGERGTRRPEERHPDERRPMKRLPKERRLTERRLRERQVKELVRSICSG